MTGTALDHRLVRDYLRRLDTAMRGWPPERAAELREQVAAHLDEALPPGASDAEVATALRRFGEPAELAAESAPAVTSRVRRIRPRTWIMAGAAVVVAGAVAAYLIITLTAATLEAGEVATWWFPQDVSHRVDAPFGDLTQTTVPIRYGQQQGYVVGLYNPSNVTETVVADGSVGTLGWDNLGGGRPARVAVSARYWEPPDSLGYGLVHRVRYVTPGAIPPHQTRLVRVLWTSSSGTCLAASDNARIETLLLRVRVGLFTRTQSIPLSQVFNIRGVPARQEPERCRHG
jgi:hypothetical protein